MTQLNIKLSDKETLELLKTDKEVYSRAVKHM